LLTAADIFGEILTMLFLGFGEKVLEAACIILFFEFRSIE